MSVVIPEERGLACVLCGEPRQTTDATHGVWTTCEYCGCDWWCVGAEHDYLDEPTVYICSGGCENGWSCECGGEWEDDE